LLALGQELEFIRNNVNVHEEHLEALENNQVFVPHLTGKNGAKASKKRKRNDMDKVGSSKRRKVTTDSNDDTNDFSDDSSELSKITGSESEDESDHESDSEKEAEEIITLTEDVLKAKIKEGKAKIKETRSELTDAREKKKDASDSITRLKKSLAKIQRDKNAFCSLERSEVRY